MLTLPAGLSKWIAELTTLTGAFLITAGAVVIIVIVLYCCKDNKHRQGWPYKTCE